MWSPTRIKIKSPIAITNKPTKCWFYYNFIPLHLVQGNCGRKNTIVSVLNNKKLKLNFLNRSFYRNEQLELILMNTEKKVFEMKIFPIILELEGAKQVSNVVCSFWESILMMFSYYFVIFNRKCSCNWRFSIAEITGNMKMGSRTSFRCSYRNFSRENDLAIHSPEFFLLDSVNLNWFPKYSIQQYSTHYLPNTTQVSHILFSTTSFIPISKKNRNKSVYLINYIMDLIT